MAEEVGQPVDLWSVLDEAELTVETWPSWQQRYEVDVYRDENEISPPAARDGDALHSSIVRTDAS